MIRRFSYYWRPLGIELGELTHWWTGQLHDLGAALLRALVPSLRKHALVNLHPAGGSLAWLKDNQAIPLFSFRKESEAQWPMDLSAFGSVEVLRNSRASVALAQDFVHAHEVVLPDVTESTLDQVIPLYLEREFPLTLDTIAIDHTVVKRDRVARQIVVRVLVIRRAILDTIVASIQGWGLRPVQVGLTGNLSQCLGNFLKPKRRALRLSKVDKWLIAGMLLLTVVTIGLIIGQWSLERYRVQTAIGDIQAQATNVQRMARQLQMNAAPAVLLSTIANEMDATDLVELLTNRTPADTWIYQLSIQSLAGSDAKLEIAAFTPPSLEYVKRLQTTEGVHQVKLVSSSSDGKNQSSKRVQVTALLTNNSRNAKFSNDK